MGGIKWTEREKKILIDIYRKDPMDDVQCTLPNRTYMAIAAMAKRLKINRPQHHSTKLLTDYEKGFLEAAVDGEGTISLYRNHNRCWHSQRGFQWTPYVALTNTNLSFLQKIKEICGGGRLYLRASRNPLRNQKALHIYEMNRGIMRGILPQLSLVVKEKQRRLLLEALGLAIHGGTSNPSIQEKQRLNDKRLGDIYKQVKVLNKRGIE